MRNGKPDLGRAVDRSLFGLLAAAWLAGLAAILSHRLYVSNDSLSNYSHVWYVAHAIWDGGTLPFHFPEIGHGDALAFPYAFIPWTTAALLRPLLGDWVTTLWLVLGFGGVIGGIWWAFPELRASSRFAVVLANPFLVESVLLSQLPFLWASAMLFGGIACWRKGWTVPAILLVGLAQGSHAAVVLPLAGILAGLAFLAGPRRPRIVVCYVLSVLVALPGIILVLLSPVVEDASTASLLANFIGTVSIRAGAVFLAPALAWLVVHRKAPQASWRIAAVTAVLLNVALIPIRDTGYAWHALARDPDTSMVPYLESPAFHPGATYRLLRIADGKVGMYQLIQHGGRLDSEFFPESIHRTSWATPAAYVQFLNGRGVDNVIVYTAYDERYQTNEHALLEGLRGAGCASVSQPQADFSVYELHLRSDRCIAQ